MLPTLGELIDALRADAARVRREAKLKDVRNRMRHTSKCGGRADGGLAHAMCVPSVIYSGRYGFPGSYGGTD
jgi:uncharacterized protein YPO0396